MNWKSLLLCVLVGFLLVQMPVWSEEGWLTNLDDGLKQAKADNKRVLVDFTATWCGWCTKLKNEVFDKKEFSDYAAKNLVLVSIDADQNRELVDKYKVSGFPTVMVMDGEGKVVDQIVGFKPLEGFLETLKKTETAPTAAPVKTPEPVTPVASETK